jgi:hypothetical protein
VALDVQQVEGSRLPRALGHGDEEALVAAEAGQLDGAAREDRLERALVAVVEGVEVPVLEQAVALVGDADDLSRVIEDDVLDVGVRGLALPAMAAPPLSSSCPTADRWASATGAASSPWCSTSRMRGWPSSR